MTKQTAFIILAVTLVAMIPIVPKMLSLRIRVLRFLKFNWFANWHEKNRDGIICGVRLILAILAVILIIYAV